MNEADLPHNIMRDVLWSLTGDTFDSSEAFSEAVRQYHIDITNKDTWNPDVVALPAPKVFVSYTYWGDDQEETTLELTSVNGRDFAALDLLFKIHNAVVDQLSGNDHHFFEGLSLNSVPPTALGLPLYTLNLGS
jgi:hypothetical protein